MRPEKPPASLLLVHGAGSDADLYADWPPAFPRSMCKQSISTSASTSVRRRTQTTPSESWKPPRTWSRPSRSAAGAWAGWPCSRPPLTSDRAALSSSSRVPRPKCRVSIPPLSLSPGASIPRRSTASFPPRWRSVGSLRSPAQSGSAGSRFPISPVLRLWSPVLRLWSPVAILRRNEVGRWLAFYGSAELRYPELSHWDLIRESQVREEIAAWLGITQPAKLQSA